MASRTIMVKEEAYAYLRSLKRNNDSFSDVILRLKKSPRSLLQFHGALRNKDWEERKKSHESVRSAFEDRL